MGDFTKAFYDRLKDDTTLAGLLAEYNGEPAIFTVRPVPESADLPFVVTEGESVHDAFDTKTTRGREILRDINVYCEQTGSAIEIEEIVDRIRALFHRHELSIDNFTTMLAEVSGPIVLGMDENIIGRSLSVRLIAMEA